MNNSNETHEFGSSMRSLYASYGQQLEQFTRPLESPTASYQLNNENTIKNKDPMSYHLYDDYDFNYYLDDVGKVPIGQPSMDIDKKSFSNQLRQQDSNGGITPTMTNNSEMQLIPQLSETSRGDQVTMDKYNFQNFVLNQQQHFEPNLSSENREYLQNRVSNDHIQNSNSTDQANYHQDQLAVAQQYYMLQLQQQKEEYDELRRNNVPFSTGGTDAGNKMALEGVKEGVELMFQKGSGSDEGHIMVSANHASENQFNKNLRASIYSNNSSQFESDISSGIGVYLSEVDGEFYLVDANGNPVFPSLNDESKGELEENEKNSDDEFDDDEKELRMLLINLMNTAAENEKVQSYIDNSYRNQLDVDMENDQDLNNGNYSTYDTLNLNQQHTSKVLSEQLKQQQEDATVRIKQLLKSNPRLQVNPKTKIELEKLPEHLRQQIIKNKKEREIDAKYIDLSEKHNFNPVQLRILQNHLTTYRASSINRNAVSMLNQYNDAYAGRVGQSYQNLAKPDSKPSKYKSILKKFQLNPSNGDSSLEEESSKIQKNITQLNDMIMSSQQNAMEQIRFFDDIINANCSKEQLKQLYIQSQGQQQTLIKRFIDVMEQQQVENPYLLTSTRVNIEPLHVSIQETLISDQMKQQEMIREQQQNLLNLQNMYENGQKFLFKGQQTENIMDTLTKQQRSKNITLDANAPASFHVYKSIKTKKSKKGKDLSPETSNSSKGASSIINSVLGSRYKNEDNINFVSPHPSKVTSEENTHAFTPGTSFSLNSPMVIERTTTPISQLNRSYSNNANSSLASSPSTSKTHRVRGRKPTTKSYSTYTCPYCYLPDSEFGSFDLKSLKPDDSRFSTISPEGKKISFNRKDHLVRHINSVHTKIKPYTCEKCGKKFARTDNMKYHVANCKQ
ncbi:hypothetical protein QEN19_002100 [Hanseniaspora menglaensis]